MPRNYNIRKGGDGEDHLYRNDGSGFRDVGRVRRNESFDSAKRRRINSSEGEYIIDFDPNSSGGFTITSPDGEVGEVGRDWPGGTKYTRRREERKKDPRTSSGGGGGGGAVGGCVGAGGNLLGGLGLLVFLGIGTYNGCTKWSDERSRDSSIARIGFFEDPEHRKLFYKYPVIDYLSDKNLNERKLSQQEIDNYSRTHPFLYEDKNLLDELESDDFEDFEDEPKDESASILYKFSSAFGKEELNPWQIILKEAEIEYRTGRSSRAAEVLEKGGDWGLRCGDLPGGLEFYIFADRYDDSNKTQRFNKFNAGMWKFLGSSTPIGRRLNVEGKLNGLDSAGMVALAWGRADYANLVFGAPMKCNNFQEFIQNPAFIRVITHGGYRR